MTEKYIVSCYNPPAQLVIKSGNTVEVDGSISGNKILAKTIRNRTDDGPTCSCGYPSKALFGKEGPVEGTVSNVRYSSDGVQFEIETKP